MSTEGSGQRWTKRWSLRHTWKCQSENQMRNRVLMEFGSVAAATQLQSDRVEPRDSQETEIHNSTEVA